MDRDESMSDRDGGSSSGNIDVGNDDNDDARREGFLEREAQGSVSEISASRHSTASSLAPSITSSIVRSSSAAAAPAPSPRNVRFDQRTRVYLIPSLEDIDDAELDSLFYSGADNVTIQSDIIQNVAVMRQNDIPVVQLPNNANANANSNVEQAEGATAQDDICFRGLEHMRSPEGMQNRREAKDRAIQHVLMQQQQQQESGTFNAEELAHISRMTSSSARNRAVVMGASDQATVRQNEMVDERRRATAALNSIMRTSNDEQLDEDEQGEDGGEESGSGSGSGSGGNGQALRDILGAASEMDLS